MMGGFGPAVGARIGAYGAVHDAIASTLGMSSEDLWNARASGQSIAELAQEKNVPLQNVVDAAAAAYSQQLDAAVKAGTLTQAQADALTQLARARIQAQFQNAAGFPRMGPGMTGGRGMMAGFGFGPRGRSHRKPHHSSRQSRGDARVAPFLY